jgi:hypothetical protein
MASAIFGTAEQLPQTGRHCIRFSPVAPVLGFRRTVLIEENATQKKLCAAPFRDIALQHRSCHIQVTPRAAEKDAATMAQTKADRIG